MNRWEREQKYRLEFVDEMVRYAEKINPDHDSEEFAAALSAWVKDYGIAFDKDWHNKNPE